MPLFFRFCEGFHEKTSSKVFPSGKMARKAWRKVPVSLKILIGLDIYALSLSLLLRKIQLPPRGSLPICAAFYF